MKPTIHDIRNLLPIANYEAREWRDTREMRIIAVHWDAQQRPSEAYSHVERLKAQADYHIAKNWAKWPRIARGFGLMYHYRIAGDGSIYYTQPEELVTWSVRDANRVALNICLDCGEGQEPTMPQLDSLLNMLDWICYDRDDLPVSREHVFGHCELTEYGNNTQCPGSILRWVQAYRAGTWGTQYEYDKEPPVSFIKETGYYVGHGFRDLWRTLGLNICGYPISNEEQDTIDPALTVQYFENVRMEYKPGMAPRIGGLGRLYRERNYGTI